MIDAIHLLPPDAGPGSNPVLFGIAAALAERLPLVVPLPSGEASLRCAPPRAIAPMQARLAAGQGEYAKPDVSHAPARPGCMQQV